MVEVNFRPKAQILIQLGDQLIKNEGIALLELIKNAYDADANKCIVTMNDIDSTLGLGEIMIEDDGTGMSFETIRDIWMQPGNTHKKYQVEKKRYSKLGRLPIGEKGIGRFGIHKLGRDIEIITRQDGQNEIYFKLDWNQFDSELFLDEIPIVIEEREPLYFREHSGTLIKIRDLDPWDRKKFRDTYQQITSLNSPFESSESFIVEFNTTLEDWLEGMMDFSKIKEFALYKSSAKFLNGNIKDFKYEFMPYDNMTVKPRKLEKDMIPLDLSEEGKKKDPARYISEKFSSQDMERLGINDFSIELYVFDKSSEVTRFIKDKNSFKEYLTENGGIRVFRDNMRILDYGEKGNDWLNLDSKRVNNPAVTLSNNIILGAISLKRESSKGLIEKANREGFISNHAYILFEKIIEKFLFEFTRERNIDKDRLRESLKENNKNLIDLITEINTSVNNLEIDKNIKSELSKKLKQVKKEYKFITETYVKTSSATSSYAIVIHEMEKIVKELTLISWNTEEISRIDNLTHRLRDVIEGYTSILRNRRKATYSVEEVIDDALFNLEFRLDAHKIKMNMPYKGKDYMVVCDKGLIISAIMNIIDNSIYWTHRSKKQEKRIFIDVHLNNDSDRVEVIIADNGLGFQGQPEDLIRPFVSNKPEGLGLGLNIVNEIMNSQKGQLLFPDNGEIVLPEEYKNGALIVLSIPKSKN
ncbi:sensor histidine kinase [Streptococcus ruminantium]|uniref:sensor histidine kinase n=1 Tax=Streptococcus ruminantium TaxID=1917441 RepID=UPI0012DC58CF|nr:sensor histidine kinase [Streptococcus ruminantium]